MNLDCYAPGTKFITRNGTIVTIQRNPCDFVFKFMAFFKDINDFGNEFLNSYTVKPDGRCLNGVISDLDIVGVYKHPITLSEEQQALINFIL